MRNTLPPCCFVRERVPGVEHFISWQPRPVEKVVQGRGFDPFELDALLEPRKIVSVYLDAH